MYAINNEKYGRAILPSRYELESKFKLIIDLSNKLDSQYRKTKTFKQLHSKNLIDLRKQISEGTSLLFCYAPIEYGANCEDVLWKRNYYDYVKFFKNVRKSIPTNELVMFRTHLISGIGHYHSLILSFRKTFHLSYLDDLIFMPIVSNKLPNYGLNDPFNMISEMSSKTMNMKQNEEQIIKRFDLDEDSDTETNIDFDLDYTFDDKFKEILLYLIARFFICIGDLARYYVDYFPENEIKFDDHYFKIASFYYKSASSLQPQLGMPYNQLGTLYTNSFYCLDLLYYYFRCLNCKKPFASVKENLKHIFEHNRMNSHQTNGFVSMNNEQYFKDDYDLVRSTIFQMINVFSQIFKIIDELENHLQPIPATKLTNDIDEALTLFRNAINIESELNSRLKPNRISFESIFQMVSIIIILIEQTKITLKKNSIEISIQNYHSLSTSSPLEGDIKLRGNFIIYISYHFLLQMITMVIHRECEIFKKMLYASQNLMDYNPRILKQKEKNKNKKKISNDVIRKRYQCSQSFSSDLGDQFDETMSQLKNTAFQTIQDVLDSSENEDEEIMLYETNDDILNQFNFNDPDDCSPERGKTFDQMLAFVYTESSTPIIKFFCDYLQSNNDFMDILQNVEALMEYFEYFFQYLNVVSEFDFKLLNNLKFYLEKHFQNNTKQMENLHYLIDLFNFINHCSSYSVKDFKQIWPLSSDMSFMNLTEELSSFYKPLFNCQDEMSLMNLKNELTVEKSSYVSIRCLIIFGIKLALLSLDNGNFELSVENYDLLTVHNFKENKYVSFMYRLYQPIKSSILKDDRYANHVMKRRTKHLIVFETNEKMENACLNDKQESSFDQNRDEDGNNKNTTPIHGLFKSLHALEKLPNILIDPYVYLEHLEQIKEIVLQKKAFLIVPKLVTDFLNNLKEKQIASAAEASDFLHEEFFRGSRMIRFIRNEDRLELEMLNYPRNYVWRRTNDDEKDWEEVERNHNMMNKFKLQDLALFYELLEHCHYLMVNKVLVISRVPTIGARHKEPNVQFTLITNNLSKWPPNASTTIAQTCGIEIETFDSYILKQESKINSSKKNKINKKYNHQTPLLNLRSQTHFRPIQCMANSETSAHRQVT